MTEETAGIERLDYSKPPPGYTADGQWWSHPPDEPSKVVFLGGYVDARNVARVAPDDGALAAAWAHYKASNDPPGLEVMDDGLFGPCPDPRLYDEQEWGARHPEWSWRRYLRHMRVLRRSAVRLAMRGGR